MNYFVPDFGTDHDIIATHNSIASEEKRQKHKWNPKQDENGVFQVPEPYDNQSYQYRNF